MRIAIISDTHGLLRPEVIEIIKNCNVIFHGGDVGTPEILIELSKLAPLYVVRGNNDRKWAEKLPGSLHVELSGVTFFMTHDKKDIPKDLSDVDAVIFGHSHQYFEERKNGRLFLNPGSCGRRRFHLPVTMAVLEITDKNIKVHRIDIQLADESPDQADS